MPNQQQSSDSADNDNSSSGEESAPAIPATSNSDDKSESFDSSILSSSEPILPNSGLEIAAGPEKLNPESVITEIQRRSQELSISGITEEQFLQIVRYRELLLETNEVMNLTRHTSVQQFVERDLLDSWQLAQLIQPNKEVLDFGTGGGIPGLLIAILRPDLDVSVCDNVSKKANAVERIVDEMNLPVPVYPTRLQKLLGEFPFDILVARAVGPLKRICGWLQPHWHTFDRLLAIKGPKWVEERGEARHRGLLTDIELRKIKSYNMPGTESESVILQLRREKPS